MTKDKLNELLDLAKEAAIKGGEEIMDVYNASEQIEHETKDDSHSSPLTIADTRAHNVIFEKLQPTDIPILSEEGADIPFNERTEWIEFWLVDPLDGTKEFIKKNDEFTVNIALIDGNNPVMGVVYVPVQKKLYWGIVGVGAFMQDEGGEIQEISVAKFSRSDDGLKIVGSKSHMNEETEKYISQFENPEVVSMGSSLKLISVAEGDAHVYPRLGPTMEWDTAAAHAVVLAAGGTVMEAESGEALRYNKENLLNPFFIVKGLESQQ